MKKRFLLLCICLGTALSMTSCKSQIDAVNTETKNAQLTKQDNSIVINNSSPSGFEGKYNDVVEIDIAFDSNGMYRDFNDIKIKDSKMISDMLTMIEKGKSISDEPQTDKMSGMANKDNKLILINKDGSKKELRFTYDSLYETGYVDMDGLRIKPDYSFFRYVQDFTEYKHFDTNVDNKAAELFNKYNWTIDYRINTSRETLPANLKYEAGEYPVKIYWAYNNELSKGIGLNFINYLGKGVDVDIYKLRESLPDSMKPMRNARGIALKYEGKVIGAYIDAGRHDSFACSLDRKSLEDITGKDWDNWVSGYINYDNELVKKLSKMSPEDIIKQYFEALDKQDEKMWAACLTLKEACSYLSMNMDNNNLFNREFSDARFGHESYIQKVKLLKIREMDNKYNPKGTKEYEATADMKVRDFATVSSGVQSRFILMKKEADKCGWRIYGDGTGP